MAERDSPRFFLSNVGGLSTQKNFQEISGILNQQDLMVFFLISYCIRFER